MPPPPPTNGGKLTPNLAMDAEGTRLLNLTVLQRLDPAVEDILITAAHVTLYDFNIDLNQWSRKDVEGSLFVVKRNTQPRFQFIVMNRRNTDNLVEDLLSDFEYELQPPYLLYRNAAQEVNGIWFYNQQDCDAVANLFGRILNAYARVPPKAKVPSTKSEFEELEAVPTSAAIDGPLEPPPASTLISDTPDESLANYFGGAASIGSVSSGSMVGRAHPSTETTAASHTPLIMPSAAQSHQIPPPFGGSSAPPLPLQDTNAHASHSTNLVTPAFFAPPSSSSASLAPPISSMMPTAPPVHSTSSSTQHPQYGHGTPLLQPFPPPAPPPSFAPAHNDGSVISRDKVKDALLRLVQSDQFIDLIYRELQNAHM
ncbi:mRNA-decapping enzyme-like protein [Aegilops tauschii subsp. strangulata]|uniref:WH1 domain-containing protein n=5 Tax=Triticinae TaxID=1648030 RepID=A0A453HNF5_AEGTS|nr:mRNA-decapping enzyme-like protein [Aegilops tauschii subsp. strangulata]XP_044374134.1 mRNA-decapping enzyme-like protein [Triticum aestivum]